MGLVFALTLPGLVLVLLGLAAVDHVALRLHGHGIVPWRSDRAVASTGFDLLHAALSPGKATSSTSGSTVELVRDEEGEGAPPRSRVDLAGGVAQLRLPTDPRS